MTRYRKPSRMSRTELTMLIVSACVLTLGLAGILAYYVMTVGWVGVGLWFTTKWFTLVVVIVAFAAFLVIAIILWIKKKKVENGEH